MGPLHHGTGSFSARNMWDPYRLRPLDSLWNPASEYVESNVLLVLYKIP